MGIRVILNPVARRRRPAAMPVQRAPRGPPPGTPPATLPGRWGGLVVSAAARPAGSLVLRHPAGPRPRGLSRPAFIGNLRPADPARGLRPLLQPARPRRPRERTIRADRPEAAPGARDRPTGPRQSRRRPRPGACIAPPPAMQQAGVRRRVPRPSLPPRHAGPDPGSQEPKQC